MIDTLPLFCFVFVGVCFCWQNGGYAQISGKIYVAKANQYSAGGLDQPAGSAIWLCADFFAGADTVFPIYHRLPSLLFDTH